MYETLIEVVLSDNLVTNVNIYPSSKSFSTLLKDGVSVTGGLCGRWTLGQINPRFCDLFLFRGWSRVEECVQHGFEKYDFMDYWT